MSSLEPLSMVLRFLWPLALVIVKNSMAAVLRVSRNSRVVSRGDLIRPISF